MVKLLKSLLIILIISAALGQFTRIPFGNGALYASEFIMFAVFSLWFLWRTYIKKSINVRWIDISVIFVIIVLLVSLLLATQVFSTNATLIGLFYWIRLCAYLFLFRITDDLIEYDPKISLSISTVIEYVIAAFAFLGLIQFLVFPDFSQYVQHGWDPHYYRVLSTFFDPNYAGLYMSIGFLFILGRWYEQKTLQRTSLLIVILISILLTYSRSTYLALFAGLSVFSVLKDKRILIVMVVLGFLAFVSIPRVQERIIGAISFDETTALRFEDYRKTYEIFSDNIVFGVGYNVFRDAQEDYGFFRNDRGVNYDGGHAGAGADNMILYIAATTGIMGLIAFGIYIVSLTYIALFSSQKAILLSILASWLIHAQFVNSFFFMWIFLLVMIIFAMYHNEKGKYVKYSS